MKTRRSGSRSGWLSNQACHCAATSGRSCSLACAQQIGQFGQGHVFLRLDRSQNHVPKGLDVMRAGIAALRFGIDRAGGPAGRDPTNGARRRDAEAFSRSATGEATRNGGNQSGTKIDGQIAL
jgi:hypothetical protein